MTADQIKPLVRAATLPVQRVVEAPAGVTFAADDPTGWWAFCDAVQECCREAAILAAWATRKLIQAEPEMPFADGFAPKAPALQTYNLAFVRKKFPRPHRDWWKGMAQSASCVLRRVEAVYRKTRFEQFGRMNRSHVSVRFPQPFPVHNASWKLRGRDERGAVVVEVALPGGRWRFALRGGPEFGRQLGILRRIERGEAKAGEGALLLQAAPGGRSGGRPVFDARHPGGGRRKFWRVMFKAVATLPAVEGNGDPANAMSLVCDPNAFWVGTCGGRQPWVLNADHVRRWIAEHRVYRQRMSEDLKHEKRWPAAVRRQMVEALERKCEKHARRMKTWRQQAAAMVAAYAERCRCAEVVYDDSKGAEWGEAYPWHQQATDLKHALAGRGIRLLAKAGAGGDVTAETA